jgi:hypothetical protein
MKVSAAQRLRASEALKNWHRKKRPLLPKCGAKTRLGHACGIIAMKNGRCWRHGGRTGKGKTWHKPVWPNDGPAAERKLSRKLADQQKDAKKRSLRLETMSSDERVRHEAWQRSHRPGSASTRANRRSEREQNAYFAATIAAEPEPDPLSFALQAEIDALERRLAAIDVVNIFD